MFFYDRIIMKEKECKKCKDIKIISRFSKDKKTPDGYDYQCKDCRKIQKREWRKNNSEHVSDYDKEYYLANKDSKRKSNLEARKRRRKNNPLLKIQESYSSSLRRAFQSIFKQKNVKSSQVLGCTNEEFREFLESKFYNHPITGEQMSFDNYGLYGWHLDHIVPISTAKSEEDVKQLSHYSNIQPLWAEDNLKKSNKYDKENIK